MGIYMRQLWKSARCKGTILILTALLLVALLGLTALAVDIGVIATAQAQLKTVTDAAALAGARQLVSERRLSTTITDLQPEIAAAKTQALATGNANFVLSHSPGLELANVQVGYLTPGPAGRTAALDQSNQLNFNSVQVSASTTVPALFSAIFGSNGSNVTVSSTATVGLYQVGYTQSLLPIAMNLSSYNNIISNIGGDQYSFNSSNYNPPSSNGVTLGKDGAVESVVYPVGSGLAGNWGTINIGVGNNSTKTLGMQITNGITPAQLATEWSSENVLSLPHTFSANPGISAGIKDDLASIIGKPVAIPVYDSSGGTGNNAWYQVTAFLPGRIVAVDMKGNDKYVIVQPAILDDSSTTPNTSQLLPWTQGGVVFVHLTR